MNATPKNQCSSNSLMAIVDDDASVWCPITHSLGKRMLQTKTNTV